MNIEYLERPELPGRKFFRCERRMAVIQAESCKSHWQAGREKNAHERYWTCRGCDVGAMHAGVSDANPSQFHNKPVCGRCLRASMRIVDGHLCVSCANRSYEWIKGRNAKGKPPVTHPELFPAAIRYVAGGVVRVSRPRLVVSAVELLVCVLRDEISRPTFGFVGRPVLPEGVVCL